MRSWGKWACFGWQDSPGKSNFSQAVRGIDTSGVNRVPKNSDPEQNVPTNLVIDWSVPKNSDTIRSACLSTFLISVFTWPNVTYLEVS